jgi:hypothetical protein
MVAHLLVSLCVVAAAHNAGVSQAPNPLLILVHVHTDEGGSAEDRAARRASVTHLAAAFAALKKGKAFVAVDDEASADVVIEVRHRGLVMPKVAIGLGTMGTRPGSRAPVIPARVVQLQVTMAAPGVSDPVEVANKNRPPDHERGWKSAAEDIAKQAEKWIAEHRAAILKARR